VTPKPLPIAAKTNPKKKSVARDVAAHPAATYVSLVRKYCVPTEKLKSLGQPQKACKATSLKLLSAP
jgi:hypothetical protein